MDVFEKNLISDSADMLGLAPINEATQRALVDALSATGMDISFPKGQVSSEVDNQMVTQATTMADLKLQLNEKLGQLGLHARIDMGETNKIDALSQLQSNIEKLKKQNSQMKSFNRNAEYVFSSSEYRIGRADGHDRLKKDENTRTRHTSENPELIRTTIRA